MWTDNETAQDFLNFGSVARTVAEVIEQAQSRLQFGRVGGEL